MSEVDANRIQSGYLSRDDWTKISQATASLSAAPIYIDDSANLTMLQVRAKAQRLALEHGIDLLVVDYLQLVSGSRRYENRTQEVTEISRGLKNLAKELDIPVIAVSQLNREIEKRSGSRKPQLSDLRESGAIEQDCRPRPLHLARTHGRRHRGGRLPGRDHYRETAQWNDRHVQTDVPETNH